MVAPVSERRRDTSEPAPALAENWNADLTARGGYAFHICHAAPADEPALAAFFTQVDPEDLRFRFPSAIRADFKRRGISWTLLDHVARFAAAKGIGTLESIESRDNHQAIGLERERGWTARPAPAIRHSYCCA